MKKTAKRRPAKKATTKAAKAIEEALGALKPAPASEPAPVTEEPVNDADEWTEYGPLGGQDEDAIAREVLGMDYGAPEDPVVAQEALSEPSEPAPAQVVPEPPVKAPQAKERTFKEKMDEKLSEIHNLNLQLEKEVHRIELEKTSPKFFLNQIEKCILNLIDALNFLHREGHLRKLPEKDILILKQRIKTGRQLIEKL